MHVGKFLHTLLSPVMHLKRLTTLTLLISGLLHDKKLSTTHLGRSIKNGAQEKNNIKRSDRCLSNKHLYKERFFIYRSVVRRLIPANSRPWILVDWSHVPNTTCYILRAALVIKGRALTLYEVVHPKKYENNPNVHRRFIALLKKILPPDCKPVMVTDAGFCNPWFKMVKEAGWDYVGRVRGNRTFRLQDEKKWTSYQDMGKRATSESFCLGEGNLTQKAPLNTFFYLIKLPKKYRVALNKLRKESHYKDDIEHSKSANEPWLLVSSLKRSPSTVISIYASRMMIEEGFRDLKSSQYGFSFEAAHSRKIRRIQILLIIAMLASTIAFFIGWVAESKQWHYQFQANSIKSRRSLSLFYLGIRVIKKQMSFPIKLLFNAIKQCLSFLEWAINPFLIQPDSLLETISLKNKL